MTRRLAVALAFAAAGASAPPAAAELVYMSARCTPDCHGEIWRVGDDGSSPLRLVDDGQTPAFNLLGTHIAYSGDGLRVMEADGSDSRLVAPPESRALDPAWSPNGALIAFTAPDELGPCTQIMIVDADGSAPPVPLGRHSCTDRFARFSPDGARIIHLTHGDVPGGPAAIVSRPLAGGPAYEVVARSEQVAPWTLAFSPDGRMLALALRGTTYTLDLVTGELVPRYLGSGEVTWSPIGPTLFFPRHSEDGRRSAIHRLDLGTPGAQPVRVSDGAHADFYPSWGALGIAPPDLPELPRLDLLPPLLDLLPVDLPVARQARRAARRVPAESLGRLFAIDPSGVRSVEVASAREERGRCRTVVDGRVQRRRATCAPRVFRRLPVGRVARVTRRLPLGRYRVWLRATDGAGNRTAQPRMLRVRVT